MSTNSDVSAMFGIISLFQEDNYLFPQYST
jgi:hypothetical protein